MDTGDRVGPGNGGRPWRTVGGSESGDGGMGSEYTPTAPGGRKTGVRDTERAAQAEGRSGDVPSWYERKATDARNRRLAAKVREPKLSRQDFFIHNFVGCYFRGHVQSESFKFNRYGNVVLTLEIPEEYKDEVLPLTDALSAPLVFWVEIEAEFREAMKDDAGS